MSVVSSPPNALWFLNTLVTVRVAKSDGSDGISVLEHRGPCGDSPPLHIHRTEDELFHILEGEFRFNLNGRELHVGAGDILLAPKGVPHTYRIQSESGGRYLTTTVHGDFEAFVRAMSRPAERVELPQPAGPPTPEAMKAFAETAARFGIEFVGPPLT